MTTDQNARSGSEAAAPSPGHRGSRGRGPGHQVGSFLKELVFVVVGALIVSSLLRAFVGQMFIIPSQSMESTLLIGDRVVVEKVTDFERGDVVVFEDPGHWLEQDEVGDPGPFDRVLEFIGIPTASTPGHLIKRVIGMPGDRVVCCDGDGRITVNGYALDETSYLYGTGKSQVEPSDVRFEVVVPKDRIFVMGDHRDLSADSRCHLADVSTEGPRGSVAFVPEDLVVGPAFAIAAPFDRAGLLHHPTTFDGVPAPAGPAPDEAVIEPTGITC